MMGLSYHVVKEEGALEVVGILHTRMGYVGRL